jgi:hypothetical protein
MIKSRRMRLTRHVARLGEKNAYNIWVGKLKGKRPLRRQRRRWVENIKIVITMIKSRRMRLARHVALLGESAYMSGKVRRKETTKKTKT